MDQRIATTPHQKKWLSAPRLILFCSLMIGLAELGRVLSIPGLGFSTVWPPCGLFFMALVCAPNIKKDWPSLIAAAAAANLISDFLMHGSTLVVTSCFIVSNSLSATSAAVVARRLMGRAASIHRLRDMLILQGCGLLIQSPIAATFGLSLQTLFWDAHWTQLKWVAWWSSNAIGISCFGIITFYTLQQAAAALDSLGRSDATRRIAAPEPFSWIQLGGTRRELAVLWGAFITISCLVYLEIIPPWGVFVTNMLSLMWAFRFGIIHSSLLLAVSSVVRISHTASNWEYMIPFSKILFLEPSTSTESLESITIASVQLLIIEWALIVNFASALITELHEKQLALSEAAHSRERLLARMSHEIRTPLSGVLGLVEAWAIKEKVQQRAFDLQIILNSAAQLKRVIDDVLDFSKLSAGKMKVYPGPCHLHELFSEIVSLHTSEAHSKGIQLALQIAENLPQRVIIDSLRLRQIINNLVGNALKFSDKGCVTISVDTVTADKEPTPMLRIVVEDGGIGMEPAAMTHLFQPFEQLGGETTRAHGGTGLGLAICRELAELLGGRINVTSRIGVGTRFSVELPFAACDAAASPKHAEHSPGGRHTPLLRPNQRAKILVAEDDPVNQLVVRRFLEAEGYTVKVVASGAQALDVLGEHAPEYSMVLMDYFMPAMDGCEVTRRFRESESAHAAEGREHLPIVGLTASVLETDHQRCREAGMDDVLLKPIERDALRATLMKYAAARPS